MIGVSADVASLRGPVPEPPKPKLKPKKKAKKG